MSKIAMSVANATSDTRAIKLLHDIIGFSLGSARERLLKGRSGVFYTAELYLNDHVQKDREIREIVKRFAELGMELYIMEIPYDAQWSSVSNFDDNRISTEDMLAILDAADGLYS